MKAATLATMAAAATLAAGCTTEDFNRAEGLTSFGGNAMAHNSALQIVDPWPEGVQDTEFQVPAHRPPVKPTSTSGAVSGLETGAND